MDKLHRNKVLESSKFTDHLKDKIALLKETDQPIALNIIIEFAGGNLEAISYKKSEIANKATATRAENFKV